MSEKRFTMEYSFEDEEYVFFDGDVALTPSETVKLLNEQQATINILLEELVNAQQQGYVIGFLHKNGRCNLTPKELENE